MKKVKIYTSPTCPYCFALKEYLKKHKIEFEEVDISKDEKAKKELIKKSDQLGVPVVEINGKIVVGFDKDKINKILKIKD